MPHSRRGCRERQALKCRIASITQRPAAARFPVAAIRARRPPLHAWLLVGLGAWCALYLVQYAREYAPLLTARLSSIRFVLRNPVDSYCTVHPKTKTPPAAALLRTRELVFAVTAESTLTPAEISALLTANWAELRGGRRTPLFEPRTTRDARQAPAIFWHVSTNRTLLLLGRGVKNETHMIHESHIRFCPRDTY